MNRLSDSAMLDAMAELAFEAGQRALEFYHSGVSVDRKADKSPQTEADRVGEEIITAGLKKIAKDIPILAEEAASEGKIPELGAEFFLVDPLDGTKEFINKTGEFTVNIALIRNGVAAMGVVYAPAINKLYGGRRGEGAFLAVIENGKPGMRRPISVRNQPVEGLTAVASRSHGSEETETFLSTLTIVERAPAGSSLKFCLVAEGLADVYPRYGRTMEWDTGAGQAVLEAAGGRVVVAESGEPLTYGKRERGYDNPYFIAWGTPA